MSRPWMPLYVADYLADTGHLTGAEHGAYLLLIMHYWQTGGLPNDDDRLARIARATPEQWTIMRDTIAEFFGEGWVHARIDDELKSAKESYERRACAGRKGGKAKINGKQSSGIAKAGLKQSQPHSSLRSEISGSIEPSSPEPEKSAPAADASPTVIELPCVSGETYPISEADVAEWRSAFPAVDIRQQLASARQWLIANPTRRKTQRGMRKFVVSWLDRRQNSAPPRQSTSPPRKRNYADVAIDRWSEANGSEIIFGNHGDVELLPAGSGESRFDDENLRSGSAWVSGRGDH